MQKLDIKIEKAQLTGYDVKFDEDGEITVRTYISLFTKEGRKVTDHSISTDSYSFETKFELPLKCYKPIMDIGSELEKVVTKHCQDPQLGLT